MVSTRPGTQSIGLEICWIFRLGHSKRSVSLLPTHSQCHQTISIHGILNYASDFGRGGEGTKPNSKSKILDSFKRGGGGCLNVIGFHSESLSPAPLDQEQTATQTAGSAQRHISGGRKGVGAGGVKGVGGLTSKSSSEYRTLFL